MQLKINVLKAGGDLLSVQGQTVPHQTTKMSRKRRPKFYLKKRNFISRGLYKGCE